MRLRNQIFLGALAVAAAGAAAWALASTRETPVSEPRTASVPVVDVRVVRCEPFTLTVRGHGEVRPRRSIELSAQVPGRVAWVAPELVNGAFLREGQELVRLETSDLELAVTLAESDVVRQRTALTLEEAQAASARAEWERSREGQPSALALREPQLAEAAARLRAAEANLAKARLDLERCVVRAPFPARVREQSVAPGRYVAPGQPLAHLSSTDVAEVVLPVRDGDLAHLELPLGFGTTADPVLAELSAEFAGARRSWQARVARVEGELDPRSRMVRVVLEVQDPFGASAAALDGAVPLLDGLFVEARLLGRTLPSAILLPRHALRLDGTVLVVEGEGTLAVRTVQVAWRDRERVVVSEGLAEGELVVVSPLAAPVPGMRVRVGRREE